MRNIQSRRVQVIPLGIKMRIYIENSKEMLPRISNEWKKIFNQKFIENNNKIEGNLAEC